MKNRLSFQSIVLLVALLSIVTFAMFGCASSPPTNSVIVHCLPLKTWPDADQDQLREEIDALPRDAKLREAFNDYIGMRDADRACQSGPKQ